LKQETITSEEPFKGEQRMRELAAQIKALNTRRSLIDLFEL